MIDIKDIAEKAGGVVALSLALGLSRAAASQWKEVPTDRVLDVCRAIDWAYTPNQIRPDIYPNPGDALPAQFRNSWKDEQAHDELGPREHELQEAA